MNLLDCRLQMFVAGLWTIALGHSQILQNRPELCGKPGQTVALPEGTTFSQAADGAAANFTFKVRGGSTRTVDLEIAESVPEVCPIAGDRLLVFGNVAGSDGPHVWVLSQIDGSVLDHLGSRGPVVSPDQRWIVYRQFYPARNQIQTENYLLYDLSKDNASNHPWKEEDPRYERPAGRLIYPVTPNHIPFGSSDRLEPLHGFLSDSFYWSPDSRFVAFADGTAGVESLVLVKVEQQDLTTYSHALMFDEVCGDESKAGTPVIGAELKNLEFLSNVEPLPDVWAYFSNIPCRQPLRQPLRLRGEDLRPAKIEMHERIGPVVRKKSVRR